MTIKIEINGIGLREHVVRTLATEIVAIYKREKNYDYDVESVMHWFDNARPKRLIICWLRLVWPGTMRHLSQSQQEH